jgi:hypothetical protein
MSEPRDDEQTDLRAALEGAFAADEGAQAAAPADAAPEPVEAPTEGQPRAADGKFAPKTETPGVTAEQSIPTTPATPAPEAETQPIRPPASWSAQAKADFATLAPHIQQEVLKRETDVTKGFEERAAKLKQYEPLDAIIDPIRGRLAANNLTPDAYFRGLANADERLRGPNRLQAFLELGQMYGVDLRQFGQPGQAQQQPQQAQLPPEYQSLAQQVAQLQQTITTQQTAAEAAANAQTQAEIDAFARDHLYFENVKPAMAALLKSGQAEDLASAYDMACWARPDIRPLVLKDQQAKDEQAARCGHGQGERRTAGGWLTHRISGAGHCPDPIRSSPLHSRRAGRRLRRRAPVIRNRGDGFAQPERNRHHHAATAAGRWRTTSPTTTPCSPA